MRTAWPRVREALVGWSVDHPRAVLALTLLLTLTFGSQLHPSGVLKNTQQPRESAHRDVT